MNRVYIVLVFFFALVFSCNKETKTEKQSLEVTSQDTVEQLEVRLIFKTNKEDVFKIMMNDIEVDELQKKNIHLSEVVSPTSNYERIVAKFDEGNMSKKIVVGLGNKEVKEVIIKDIVVSYKNNIVEIYSPQDFKKYIRLNKYVDLDTTNAILLSTKKIEGKHSPSFSLTKKLLNQLEK